MNGINHVFILGNLGTNPIVEIVGETKKARLFVLCNSKQKEVNKETGEVTYKDVASPVNVECWGHLAEYVEKYQKKGSTIVLEGTYEFNEFEKEGVKQTRPFVKAYNIIGINTSMSEIDKLKMTLGHIQFAEEQQLDLGALRERIKTKIAELSTKVDSVTV